jgi:phosphopantothenoylcysteine decarboxylase/phosphopantothenate--cysteine ligase
MNKANVLIGTTGGIAVYKIAQLVRELRKEGFNIKLIMTPFSTKFITPLTFRTLSGNRVFSDTEWETEPLAHIELARWADTFLIAPCTVNTLSKLACAIADNLLTTTALAYPEPILIAPAANTVMYKNRAVQENISRLKEKGHIIIEPEFGVLACEEVGEGKLASIDRLKDWILFSLEEKPLRGKRVLITCGATREYIDPVRFISNDASGELGFALARVSRWWGAQVKVVAGFTTAEEPPEVDIFRVKSVEDMYRTTKELFKWADILIMNAAVSDFIPERVSERKIKKKKELTLKLVKGVDILGELGKLKGDKFLVGFALETENLIENAKEKLSSKNLDMIVANPWTAIGSKKHEGWIITKKGIEPFEAESKLTSARRILKRVCDNISL